MMMKKQVYKKPRIQKIRIDNQISLVMMTNEFTPPSGPFGNTHTENKKTNPYKA